MSTISYLIGSKLDGVDRSMVNHASETTNTLSPGNKTSAISYNATEFAGSIYPVPGIQWRNRAPGPIQKTDNPFHLSIQGPGFFEMSDGAYTRDGSFGLNLEGTLVSTIDEMPVVDVTGDPIVIPPGMRKEDFSINASGQIVDQKGELLGQLKLVEFNDINTLRNAGNNRYRSDDAPSPATKSRVLQGALEGSNGQLPKILAAASSTKTDA